MNDKDHSFAALLAFGAHIPSLRLERSDIAQAMSWLNPPGRTAPRGSRAIANWDEDSLTMGVEAARNCLAASTTASPAMRVIESVIFCSTTAPFADRDDAVLVSAAAGLPEAIETANFCSSLRAGTAGFMAAARRADARSLVVAADTRRARPGSAQELTYGDAAASLLFGPRDPHALANVVAMTSAAGDFVDHYRMQGSGFDYSLEERWVRDEFLLQWVPKVVAQLLSSAGCDPAQIRHFILPVAAAGAKRIADACGLGHARRDERVLIECGDAGAALPLLLLGASLENARADDLVLMVGIGQGIDAVLLRATTSSADCGAITSALARGRKETSYTRYLAHRGLLDVDFGMRAERDQRTAQSVAFRKREALSGFVGGRCSLCDTVQFPRSRVCVNPQCRATDTQQPHRLAESTGRVKTFTEDWQAFAARPPYVYGNVEFSEGGNLLMEFTDVDSGDLSIDDRVRFVFRIKDDDRARGFRRYFWKATKA